MQPVAASESDYHIRLGLTSDPFAAGAMPEFFFVGAQRRFLAQRAVHALYFSGATVLILGADGIGKTRTLVEIEKDLIDLADICRIDATVFMNAAEIRALLSSILGLPGAAAAGNTELVYALERIRPGEGDPQPVLIAIDAAHLLSIETLAEIAALVAGAGGRLRLLLAGEADLLTAWQHAQAGVAVILELKPLDRNEIEDYVHTKMQAAGYRDERLLSDVEFDELFAQSNGNFATINALMPQLLQPQPKSTADIRRGRALPMLHIGAAAALLAIIIVLMLYRTDDSESSQKIKPREKSKDIAQLSFDQKNSAEKNTAETSTVALQLPAPISQANTAEPSALPTVSSSAILPPSNAVTNIPVDAASSTSTSVAIEKKLKANESKLAVENGLTAEVKPNVEVKPAEKSASAPKPVVTKKESPDKKPTAENVAVSNETSTHTVGERALLEFPPSHYVLQLMGAESKTTVDKFAKGAGKGVKLYVYRTQLRGKPWFIVLTGPYADKNAAQAGLADLPEAVRKQQPWPRTLANVQADIRAHSGR